MIYLLGGPPRVGKSIISRTITGRRGISAVSTDSLAAILESVLGPTLEPRLFAIEKLERRSPEGAGGWMAQSSVARMSCLLEESRAVWSAVRPFIGRESEEGRDVLVEGVALMPGLTAGLEGVDHRAVFIGCQGDDHKRNITQGAAGNQFDWMRHASDEYIARFADFVAEMSAYIEREAREHGYPYVEMGQVSFSEVAGLVEDALFG